MTRGKTDGSVWGTDGLADDRVTTRRLRPTCRVTRATLRLIAGASGRFLTRFPPPRPRPVHVGTDLLTGVRATFSS